MSHVPRGVLDEFIRYVDNDIPFRLIYTPEMKLVDRFYVQEIYRPSIEAIREVDIIDMCTAGED